jgi:inner membrane transporter RhtA
MSSAMSGSAGVADGSDAVAGGPSASARRPRWRACLVPAPVLVFLSIASTAAGSGYAVPLIAQVGAVPAAWLRITVGSLVLAVVRPFWRSRPDARAWRAAALLGVSLAVMNTSFYLAIGRIPLGVAVALEFWGPLALGIVGSRRRLDLLWVALAGGGIVILTGGPLGGDDLVGVLFALNSGLFWAVYILTGAKLGRVWPDGRGLGAAMVVAAAVLAVPAIVLGGSRILQAEVLAAALLVALLASVVPYTLQLIALRTMSPGAFGVLMSLGPALSGLAGLLILGQVLNMAQVAGIAMVVAASIGVSVASPRRPDLTEELALGSGGE